MTVLWSQQTPTILSCLIHATIQLNNGAPLDPSTHQTQINQTFGAINTVRGSWSPPRCQRIAWSHLLYHFCPDMQVSMSKNACFYFIISNRTFLQFNSSLLSVCVWRIKSAALWLSRHCDRGQMSITILLTHLSYCVMPDALSRSVKTIRVQE